MRSLSLAITLVLAACGSSAPPATTTPSTTETRASATRRACFTGTIDNGVCETFDASREPLSLVSAHCHESGGTWMEACPDEGRIGACEGEGRHATYYGLGLSVHDLQTACEAEGHTFVP